MKQEDKANKVCKELTRFNDTLLYLESVKDDFYYFRCAKGMGYVDLEAYITAEEKKRHHPANQTIHQGTSRPKATGICGALIKTKRI